jgi:hypothetical protein
MDSGADAADPLGQPMRHGVAPLEDGLIPGTGRTGPGIVILPLLVSSSIRGALLSG